MSDTKNQYYMLKGLIQDLEPEQLQEVSEAKAELKQLSEKYNNGATIAMSLALLEIDIYGEVKA